MKNMNDLLAFYGVTSLEELKTLIMNGDPKVKDLKEFITYYLLQEEEK